MHDNDLLIRPTATSSSNYDKFIPFLLYKSMQCPFNSIRKKKTVSSKASLLQLFTAEWKSTKPGRIIRLKNPNTCHMYQSIRKVKMPQKERRKERFVNN